MTKRSNTGYVSASWRSQVCICGKQDVLKATQTRKITTSFLQHTLIFVNHNTTVMEKGLGLFERECFYLSYRFT